MSQHCCPKCFGDRDLHKEIIPRLSLGCGVCSFCGTGEIDLVEPRALEAYFELLISIYEPDPAGKLLVEWLKGDWNLFSHPRMNVHAARALLAEILNDGEVVRQTYSPSPAYMKYELYSWAKIRDELMYSNRFFPEEHLDKVRFKRLLSYLQADDLTLTWYRARILTGSDVIPISDMSAPSARLVSHGRANPPGIPYLYLGSTPQTAVAEVRPHTGEVACVADFTIGDGIRAVDLRNPRQRVSPFLLPDEDEIGLLRVNIPFLEHLGEELTRPVLPQGAAIDYVPSQYLCEFIKKCGYDGVVYRSSVSDGVNLTLFDPTNAAGGSVALYNIIRVSVEVTPA